MTAQRLFTVLLVCVALIAFTGAVLVGWLGVLAFYNGFMVAVLANDVRAMKENQHGLSAAALD